jgi:VanZ family protein
MNLKRGVLRFFVFRFPALVYMVLVFYLSSGPVTSPTLNSIPDYYLHSAGYLLLSILVFWAVHQGFDPAKGDAEGYSLPLLITVLYGISDEMHQGFVPSRNSEVKDVVSDAAGALLGAALVFVFRSLISYFRRTRTA